MSGHTLSEDLTATAARMPAATAVIAASGDISYAELDGAADRLAGSLAGLGVKRGDRVATLLPNDIDAVISIYAAFRAGAILMPLHPTMKRDKLARLLAGADARVVITDSEHAATARRAAPAEARVIERQRTLRGGPRPRAPLSVDLAAVLFTSGSTGEPNGVTLTHQNMSFVAGAIVDYLGLRANDRVLCALPLSFGYGLYQLLTAMRVGAVLVLEPGIRLLGSLVRKLEQQRITFLPGVPTLFEMLVSFEGLSGIDLPHLRVLTNAGAALPVPTVERLRELLPRAQLFCMYGQTECQRVCYLPPDEVETRAGSVGIAIPGTEVWIEDDAGEPVGPDQVGELFVRGGHVMQGYWNDPEATASRLRGGPAGERVLATGDLFRQDADGYLYFVSRRDDIIKSRGEKVAPREIEEVLRGAPGIREAAVIGVPDRLLGEAVQAHVASQPGHELDERSLLTLCAERLEDYMVPRRVVIHDELPRTANGKLDRRALADADGGA